MTRSRKLWLALAVTVAVLGASIYWLVATPSGARWVLARAQGLLPVQMTLGEMQGTLARGLDFESVDWRDDTVLFRAEQLFVHVELLPLLQRVVRVHDIRTSSIDLRLQEVADQPEPATEPFEVDLPVDILLEQASFERISIQHGDVRRSLDAIRIAASLRGSQLDVSQLNIDSDWLNVDAEGEIRLAGRYAAKARLGWSLVVNGETLEGELSVDGDTRSYQLSHTLQRPFPVTSEGNIALDGQQPVIDLASRWSDLHLDIAERELLSAEGALQLNGPLSALEIRLDALAQTAGVPRTQVMLGGTTDLRRMDDIRLDVQNEIGLLSARGRVQWAPTIAFEASYTLSDIDPSFIHPATSGSIGLTGSAAGQYTVDDVTNVANADAIGASYAIDVTLESVSGNLNNAPLAGSGRIGLDSESASIDALELSLGSNRLQLHGRVDESATLAAAGVFSDLSQLLPGAGGSMQVDVEVGGLRSAPEIELIARSSRLTWSDLSLDTATAELSLDSSGRLDADIAIVQLSSGAQTIDSGAIGVGGSLQDHQIDARLSGFDAVLLVSATGAYAEPQWAGEITSIDIDHRSAGRWVSESAVALTSSHVAADLGQLCLLRSDGAGRACLQGSYQADGDAEAALTVEGLPVAALPIALPESFTTEGNVFASANGRLSDKRLSGSSTVDLRDFAIRTSLDGEVYETHFSVASARAVLGDNRLDAHVDLRTSDDTAAIDATLDITDILLPDSAIAGAGSLRVDDLGLLATLIPDLGNSEGKISGSLGLGGRLDVPEITGEIRLTDGAFGIRRAGIEVAEVDISLSQQKPGTLQLRGSARSGEGRLEISGDTFLDDETGLRTELEISGEDFQILRLPDWQASASPDVEIVIDQRQTVITGALAVPRATIRVKEIPDTAIEPSTDAVVHKADATQKDEMKRTLDVDLRASLGDDVSLAAFGLRTGLGGSLQLRGGRGQPFRGFGRVELKDGTYQSYGQDLAIERGLLIFNGPLDSPQLDIRATRQIDDIVAGIHLTGTPAALLSTVYSEPAMRDAEALSYLLTGRPVSDATSTGDGDLLGNAAFALGLSGAGLVASRVRSQLGLDSLSIEGGAANGRIVAGKRLSSRLLVEYGYGLVDRLGSLLLRYQLNERLVIESRTGANSNFDIVYRVRKQ